MEIFEGDLSNVSLMDFPMEVDVSSDHEAVLEETLRDQLQAEVNNNWRSQEEAEIILYRFHTDRLLLLGAVSVRSS